MTSYFDDYIISDDKTLIESEAVLNMLQNEYWAKERTITEVMKTIETSICFGLYKGEKQIGFARIVTDYVTIFWLTDVVIDRDYRGLGLGKKLVEEILEEDKFKGLNGVLATEYAHGLYSKFGFVNKPDLFMHKPK